MAGRQYDFDVIVLGGGSAGIVSGVTAGALGLRVLLIEKHRMGGECLNTGCVPSKALLHSARVASLMKNADRFGLKPRRLSAADVKGVMPHVRASIITVRDADATERLLQDQGVILRHGSARFTDPHTISLEGETFRADHFIVATGSRPAVPPIPGLAEAGFITNTELFSLIEPPRSLVVIGGGPLGVEMAQAFHRLGSRVTLLQRNASLLPRDDREVALELERLLKEEGLIVHTGAAVDRVELGDGLRRVHFRTGSTSGAVDCDTILVAAGRRPNVEGLDLPAAGIQADHHGILVDSYLHTTGPRAWACGDVTGRHQFSHMAEYEAKLVVQNLFLPVRQKADFRVVPWTTFTDPEVSHVGITEEEARAQGLRFEVHRHRFGQDDRALVDGEDAGFVKIISTGWSGKILGAHIIGPRSGELIQEFVLAMRHGLSIRSIADAVHVYPTLTVASQRAAQRWYETRSQERVSRMALGAYRKARASGPAMRIGAAAGVSVVGLLAWGWSQARTHRNRSDEHDADNPSNG